MCAYNVGLMGKFFAENERDEKFNTVTVSPPPPQSVFTIACKNEIGKVVILYENE